MGDERWRNSRGQQPSSHGQANQQRRQNAPRKQNSISQVPVKVTGEKQEGSKAMPSGNWTGERTLGEGRNTPSVAPTSAAVFKAQETKDFLKRGFPSLSGEEAKALRYKPPQIANKTGGPWGSKPNTMGSGKDFFLELRKQMSNLQHAERAGG